MIQNLKCLLLGHVFTKASLMTSVECQRCHRSWHTKLAPQPQKRKP